MPHLVRPAEFKRCVLQREGGSEGLHECMHVVYVCNVYGSSVLFFFFVFFKASSKGILLSYTARFPFGLVDREHTQS